MRILIVVSMMARSTFAFANDQIQPCPKDLQAKANQAYIETSMTPVCVVIELNPLPALSNHSAVRFLPFVRGLGPKRAQGGGVELFN